MHAKGFDQDNTGAELLATLADNSTLLSDQDIDAIVRHLEGLYPNLATGSDGRQAYKSTDLRLGSRRRPFIVSERDRNAAGEQFDLQRQADAFRFVKLDARIEQRLGRTMPWIRIQGVKRGFFHHQLYAAYWLLVEECGFCRGKIVADLMGLGKTTTAFLYILLNYFLTENMRDIQQHPSRHCPRPVSGPHEQSTGMLCPSRREWPIQCACQKHSPAHRLVPSQGASLVFVPASLVGNWVSEWEKLGIDHSIKLRLYIHHGAFPYSSIPESYLPHLKLQRIAGHGPTAVMELPHSAVAHRFIVMTTVESYYERVQSHCGNRGRQWRISSNGEKSDLTDGFAWGRIIRDEAHLTPNYNTRLYRILESLVNNGWIAPNFLALTGTPMLRNGVSDMLALVKIINMVSPALYQLPAYQDFTQPAFLDRIAAHAAAAKDAAFGQTIGKLIVAYCIRRRSDSRQNGKALAYIPPLECIDIIGPSPTVKSSHLVLRAEGMLKKHLSRALSNQLTAWLHNGGRMEDFSVDTSVLLENVRLTRMLATVPALSEYGDKENLSWRYIESQGWHLRPRESLFFRLMEDLVVSSGKLQALRLFLERWNPCKASDGEPERLVILSEIPFICHIVVCFCLKLGFSCEWIHSKISTAEKQRLVELFQSKRPTDGTRGQTSPFRIMIGSTGILGQGVTLNRAHRLILMEPSHHAAVEEQNADRVHRLGSETDKCWFYRLINPASALETILMAQQEEQIEFQRIAEWVHLLPDTIEAEGVVDESFRCDTTDQPWDSCWA